MMVVELVLARTTLGMTEASATRMFWASITREYFSDREVEAQNFFLAFTEVMAHIELMQEAGDISTNGSPAGGNVWSNGLGPDVPVTWNGTDLFSAFIDRL